MRKDSFSDNDFSYSICFYRNNIYSLDSENFEPYKKACLDAKEIEKYFVEKTGGMNIEALRENIVQSFKFNRDLCVKDRINYIRGLVYSRRYIDFCDIFHFSDYLSSTNEDVVATSVYREKNNSNRIDDDFFAEAFYEDEKSTYDSFMALQREMYKDSKSTLKLGDNDELDDDYDDEDIEELEDEDDDLLSGDVLSDYIDLTPREVIEHFENNFEEFIEIMLERRNVSKAKNSLERKYVVLGMRDWYEYVITMFKDMYEINQKQKKLSSKDLSQFI